MFNKSLRGAEFITFIKSAEVYDPSKLLKDVGVTVEEANVVNEVEDIHIIVPEVIPEVQDVTGADAQLEDQESEDEEVVTTITETYADDGDNQEDDDDEMLVDGNGQLVDDYDDDEDDDDEDDEIDEEVDDDLIADENAVDVSTLQDAINEVANDTINDDRKEEDPSEGSEADDEEDEAAEFVMDTEGDPDMVDMEFMETDFAYLNKKKRAEKSRTP